MRPGLGGWAWILAECYDVCMAKPDHPNKLQFTVEMRRSRAYPAYIKFRTPEDQHLSVFIPRARFGNGVPSKIVVSINGCADAEWADEQSLKSE